MKNYYTKEEVLLQKFIELVCLLRRYNHEEVREHWRRNEIMEYLQKIEPLMETDFLESENKKN